MIEIRVICKNSNDFYIVGAFEMKTGIVINIMDCIMTQLIGCLRRVPWFWMSLCKATEVSKIQKILSDVNWTFRRTPYYEDFPQRSRKDYGKNIGIQHRRPLLILPWARLSHELLYWILLSTRPLSLANPVKEIK